MEHIERMWSFVENQRYCLSLTNIAHLHTSHDPFITSHLRFPHLCGTLNHALVGSVSGVQIQTSKFLLLSLNIIQNREQPFLPCDMTKNCNSSSKIKKWSIFAKNRSLTFVTPSQHVNTNRHKCQPSIDWKCHFAFIIPRMMGKSTLVLPVEYQNQARPIESAEPSSFSSISLNANQNPLTTMIWWKEARMTVPAMIHDEIMKQFVENQRSCLNSPNIAQMHTWPFHNKSSPISNLVWNFDHALVGVYRECKFKLLNFFYYPSISYKIENNPPCHVTWWKIATDRWKSAKWPDFAKIRPLTYGTPSQHVIPNRLLFSVEYRLETSFCIYYSQKVQKIKTGSSFQAPKSSNAD